MDAYGNELYHFGVKGMKWGVRRFQKSDGTLTSAGKKRYKPTAADIRRYGKRGAQRVADRRNNGDSYITAQRKEMGRAAIRTTGVAVGALAVYYALHTDKGRQAVFNGKEFVKDAYKKYYNTEILDSSGKVIKRYHTAAKNGARFVRGLLG